MNRAGLLLLLTGFTLPVHAQTRRPLSVNEQRARDIFEQLINSGSGGR